MSETQVGLNEEQKKYINEKLIAIEKNLIEKFNEVVDALKSEERNHQSLLEKMRILEGKVNFIDSFVQKSLESGHPAPDQKEEEVNEQPSQQPEPKIEVVVLDDYEDKYSLMVNLKNFEEEGFVGIVCYDTSDGAPVDVTQYIDQPVKDLITQRIYEAKNKLDGWYWVKLLQVHERPKEEVEEVVDGE